MKILNFPQFMKVSRPQQCYIYFAEHSGEACLPKVFENISLERGQAVPYFCLRKERQDIDYFTNYFSAFTA